MTVLKFFSQFIDAIENGTKTSTIRRHRDTNPVQVGDILDLFTITGQWFTSVGVSSVTPVTITSNGITLGGRKLTSEEALVLAQKEGFVSVGALIQFIDGLYGLPGEGLEVISWAVVGADKDSATPDAQPPLPCLYCQQPTLEYSVVEHRLVCQICWMECPESPTEQSAIATHNLVASNYAEAIKSMPLHVAALARQDSLIGTLKRRIAKLEEALEKTPPSPPEAVAPYHRLNTEDSE